MSVQYIYKYYGKNGFPYYITHVNGVAYFVRNAYKLIRDGAAVEIRENKWLFKGTAKLVSEDRVDLI